MLRRSTGHRLDLGAALSRSEQPPKHLLAAQVRRLVEAVAVLDADSVCAVDLETFTDRARILTDIVEAAPSLTSRGGPHRAGGRASALDERSPISGRSNPGSPPLTMLFDGERVTGHATYGWKHEGPPETVHGGWVAAAFDEVLGLAQSAAGVRGHTGTLTIVMRAPTPLHTRIDYEGWLDRAEGRKLFCAGHAHANGVLLAEASGIFITPRDE